MKKSARVKSIYRELKNSVGSHFTSSELLSAAAKLIEFENNEYQKRDTKIIAQSNSSHNKPLDTLMSDGGWRIMGSEFRNDYFQRFDVDCSPCPQPKQWHLRLDDRSFEDLLNDGL